MEAKDLVVGGKYMYQDTDEKVVATVMVIDTENEIVHFKDWEDFEWEELFQDIPQTIINKL